MYHYVRSYDINNPYSQHKDISEFNNECDYFKKNTLSINVKDLFNRNLNLSRECVLITFDDGLKDHINAAEILISHGLTATFYIPTSPYIKKNVLDVHKVHILCRKYGPECLSIMNQVCLREGYNPKMLIKESDWLKNKDRYKSQSDDENIKLFKKSMNYLFEAKVKRLLLDKMLEKVSITIKTDDVYLKKTEIEYLIKNNFEIGSHGISHSVFSRMTKIEKLNELKYSKEYLQSILGININSFAYPYGRKGTYDNETIKLLNELGYQSAVAVEEKDIDQKQIDKIKYEIPRYDCNMIKELYA